MTTREEQRLGQGDRELVMFRRLWLRELQALADGKPVKQWTVPAK